MMKYQLLIFISIVLHAKVFSQNPPVNSSDTLSFTLNKALEFAMSNNTEVRNAYADIAYAEEQVKETRSYGLPQLKGQLQYQQNLKKQVFVFPNAAGVPTPIRIGNTYTNFGALNVSWLMLDATYLLGLKAAKEFTDLSKTIASKTETNVKIDIAKTYFMALIAKENIGLINSNLNTLHKTLDQVKALNKEGFTESLEVDRLQLQHNNLEINKQKVTDQYYIVLGLLKVKLGISPEKPIKLEDDINSIYERYNSVDTSGVLDLQARTDYQILQQQLVLNKFDVKRYQYSKYPNLTGFASYQQTNYGESINLETWYASSFYTLQVNVPIFAGFGNDAKIQKARIEQIKTENTINNAKNMIDLDVFQSKLKYLRAMEYVTQQKENLELANRILEITTTKYNEGVGSNLELITANQDVKNSQTNYLSAMYDLLISKLDYQVAIGQNIKL